MKPREFRESLGLTQEQVALELGISQGTVSRIEAGATPTFLTKAAYDAWATTIAAQKRLPRAKRLSWGHLLG